MQRGNETEKQRKLDATEQKLFGKEVIPVTYLKKTSGFWDIMGWILPFLMLFLLWQYVVRRSAGAGGSTYVL